MGASSHRTYADRWDASNEVSIDDPLGDETESDFSAPAKWYGADFTVDDLIARLNDDNIFVPPFQRSYVWSLEDASRFVESLLLNLPVPGIFLAKEYDADRYLIIDGHQRLRSLQLFRHGTFEPTGAPFQLQGVQERFEGKSYHDLSPQMRADLDSALIHATIVHQEDPLGEQSSVYHIFERLNTGGRALTSQEIRSALYHGAFRQLLSELNEDDHWRAIFGAPDPRMRDQELILRFLALLFYREDYKPPMKEFLNRYMAQNRNLDVQPAPRIEEAFRDTINRFHGALGEGAFKPGGQFNAAVFDAAMVGLATRLRTGPDIRSGNIKQAYDRLLGDEEFQKAYQQSTANAKSVEARTNLAVDAFSGGAR